MKRDSLFGERIVWVGRPSGVSTPAFAKAIAGLLAALSVISLCFAIAVALVLERAPGSLVLFAAWTATLALLAVRLPARWLARSEFVITDQHVIWRNGPVRRTIDRKAISFCRIFWDPKRPGVGDLELVRAVPTGALRRRLTLRLAGLAVPDRVWAIVRGIDAALPAGVGERPLAQRLDDGERVVWSARPRRSAGAWLPRGRREWGMLAFALLLGVAVVQMIVRAVPNALGMLDAGLAGDSAGFLALVSGQVLAAGVLLATIGGLIYKAVIEPARLIDDTRYLITNRRVLIQRGHEELHLDRSRIVDVIDTPARGGLHDVFLVLDGPRARALAASGAFGELDGGPALRPVLRSVADAEGVSRILDEYEDPPSRAAA